MFCVVVNISSTNGNQRLRSVATLSRARMHIGRRKGTNKIDN